jgi:hypothetical protein
MSCTCNQTFTGSAADLYNEIATKIQQNHGTITGDASSGTFSVPTPLGGVEGSYTITGQQITIQITKKPLVLGCGTICDYIKNNITV